MIKHDKQAKHSIENFCIEKSEYIEWENDKNIKIVGNGSIFCKEKESVRASINIDFGATKGCNVFLGKNLKGSISIAFKGNNSLLYVGDNCKLNQVTIRSFQANDFIAVGEGVTTTSSNVWISGNGAGDANPAIIIGDDCMFAYDIVIRNTDAHPIFSLKTDTQVNEPKGIIHIEPHVWIGEQVNILKSVTIGACSILSLGSIVTKDVPRFSVASGIPAKAKLKNDIYWARNTSKYAKDRAKFFVEKFANLSSS